MDPINRFLTNYSHLLSLINGLAFFIIGFQVALDKDHVSTPKLASPLRMLSLCGFAASLASWLQMFMLTQNQLTSSSITAVLQATRLFSMVLAAIFLLRFSTQLITNSTQRFRWVRWILPIACVLYPIVVALIFVGPVVSYLELISTADALARYFLLLPGLVLATLGFWSEYKNFMGREMLEIAGDCRGASIAFGLKSIISGLVAFPLLSDTLLLPSVVLAISVSRMLSNVAIVYFVVRVLRGFEIERNKQLATAVEQRLLAQQETLATQRQAHSEVEQWVRQLEDLVDSIASAMSTVTSVDEILSGSLRKVLELTSFVAGDILIVQAGDPELQLVVQIGLTDLTDACKIALRPDTQRLRDIQATGKTAIVWNLLELPNFDELPLYKAGFRCLVNILVICRGNLLGIMNLLGENEKMPQNHELKVLSAIGQQIGAAIENSRLYEQAQSMAALAERERLGWELHDGLAQVLGYLYLKSYSVNELLRAGQLPAAQAGLNEMQEIARETQRDVREAILGLRTTITPETGIIPTLKEYVRRFSQESGIDTKLLTGNDTHMDFEPGVEIQLLRIVQEALTNIRKHSQAVHAFVRFDCDGEMVQINIEDDGHGFDPERINGIGHFGLHTMRERAQSVGGDLQLFSDIGHGTRVVVRLPCKQWRM